MSKVKGIHHVTAITRDAQMNFDFYAKVLGLRFVKKTVNFDDPYSYHLYYGDATGSPGTAMTFFVWPSLPEGSQGKGTISRVLFAVPKGAIGFWKKHLRDHGVAVGGEEYFGLESLELQDPDGLEIRLVAAEDSNPRSWEGSRVPLEYQIQHIYGVELSIEDSLDEMRGLLDFLGYRREESEGNLFHLVNSEIHSSNAVDLRLCPSCKPGRVALGSTHHAAFRVESDEDQAFVRKGLIERGLHPTPVIERFYFRSVYSKVPEDILFEIATDSPGFLIDESEEDLGKSLRLPPHYEDHRAAIEPSLVPFNTDL